MLKLLATALDDGLAVVYDGTRPLLLRPPYWRSTVQELPSTAVDELVQKAGFQRAETEFAGWPELIAFLTSRYGDAVAARRKQFAATATAAETIRASSESDAEHYVGAIETELLPNGDLATAEMLLALLFEARTVQNSRSLYGRCTHALRRIQELRANSRTRALVLNSTDLIEASAPCASERFTSEAIREFVVDIQVRGQVWSIGP